MRGTVSFAHQGKVTLGHLATKLNVGPQEVPFAISHHCEAVTHLMHYGLALVVAFFDGAEQQHSFRPDLSTP